MFILFSISNALKFWSVNDASIYELLDQRFPNVIKFSSEISNNWPNDLCLTNMCKALESCS